MLRMIDDLKFTHPWSSIHRGRVDFKLEKSRNYKISRKKSTEKKTPTKLPIQQHLCTQPENIINSTAFSISTISYKHVPICLPAHSNQVASSKYMFLSNNLSETVICKRFTFEIYSNDFHSHVDRSRNIVVLQLCPTFNRFVTGSQLTRHDQMIQCCQLVTL